MIWRCKHRKPGDGEIADGCGWQGELPGIPEKCPSCGSSILRLMPGALPPPVSPLDRTRPRAIIFWENGWCYAAAGASASTGPHDDLHAAWRAADAAGLEVIDVQRTRGLLPPVTEKAP